MDTSTGLQHPCRFALNNAKYVTFPEDVSKYDKITEYLADKGIDIEDESNECEL
ncbi:MAG: hypothetical protein ACFFE7_16260 [Candidatus Thorarchaeota archaeon]